MFSYEWFSRYALIEKLKRNVTSKGTETRTNEVIAIDWCTLSNTAYTCNVLMVWDRYCLYSKSKFLIIEFANIQTCKQYEQHPFFFRELVVYEMAALTFKFVPIL